MYVVHKKACFVRAFIVILGPIILSITSLFPYLELSPLSLISTAVWHITQGVQHTDAPTSPPMSPSMLYLSLASCLRRRVGMQGMKQPSRQYSRPLLPRSLAVP